MIGQLSRFAGVGAAATLLHVFAALLASSVLGFSPQAANAMGFSAAVALSYFGHGQFTFGSHREHRFHAPRFLATSGLCLALSSAITQVISVSFGAPFAIAMGVVAVVVPVATFVLCKFWVFAEPQPEGP